jgi:hypothetical protein
MYARPAGHPLPRGSSSAANAGLNFRRSVYDFSGAAKQKGLSYDSPSAFSADLPQNLYLDKQIYVGFLCVAQVGRNAGIVDSSEVIRQAAYRAIVGAALALTVDVLVHRAKPPSVIPTR